MFIQLKDLENLDIKKGSVKEISFDCAIYDELLDEDRIVTMTIPQAYLRNAKIIKETIKTDIVKNGGMTSYTTNEDVRLRLDFVLIQNMDIDDKKYYYKAEVIKED